MSLSPSALEREVANLLAADILPTDECHDTFAHSRRVIEATISGIATRSLQAWQQAKTIVS
jgi:hypothetical protein